MNHPLSDFLPVRPADTVILDTDICTDCDDCGALAVLFYYCKKNNIKIGAVINDIDNLYGCSAVDAIASYYGMEVSIGMTTDKGFRSEDESRYSRQISEQFSEKFRNGTLTVRPALELYREVLQNAADKSVVIITVGFLNTAAEIFAAEPELFASKVRCVVSMAGDFADLTHPEFNIAMQIPAAQTFYNHCPVPVYFHGFEIGVSFQTGFAAPDPQNPVSVAYELHNHGHNASFDPAAVDFAFRGVCSDWALSEPVSVHVNDDGTVSYQPDENALRTYVKFADEEARERVRILLDEIYAASVR